MPRKHPDRLLPSKKLRTEWRKTAEHIGDAPQTYVSEWLKFWTAALDELIEQETWEDRDVRVLEEYVEQKRLADFHGRKANADPYRTHRESGRTFAHPGFKLQQDALVRAGVIAERLLLGVDLGDEDEDDEDEDGPPPVVDE